ncbi:hypothetical protein [Pedobacter sp. NJ-S-72]
MKTSTMLIITAILIILGSLVAFNYTLKAVYLTGEYKSRFNGMDFTPINGIEKLNIQTERLSSVQVEYGEKEGIWVGRDIKEKVKFEAHQQTLNLGESDASKQEKSSWINGGIIIITKNLNAIVTVSGYTPKQGERYSYGSSEISLKGYHLGQLDLQITSYASVYLHHMEVQTLNATVGTKTSEGSELTLSSDTKINNAIFNVPGNSKLTLINPKIVKTNYMLSDSATVSLNGKVVQMIK